MIPTQAVPELPTRLSQESAKSKFICYNICMSHNCICCTPESTQLNRTRNQSLHFGGFERKREKEREEWTWFSPQVYRSSNRDKKNFHSLMQCPARQPLWNLCQNSRILQSRQLTPLHQWSIALNTRSAVQRVYRRRTRDSVKPSLVSIVVFLEHHQKWA